MNACLFNALLIFTKKMKGKKVFFFKTPRPQCPNQGSHMMEFLLLSVESVYMIAIRALSGMQLISNEEKNVKVTNTRLYCLKIC